MEKRNKNIIIGVVVIVLVIVIVVTVMVVGSHPAVAPVQNNTMNNQQAATTTAMPTTGSYASTVDGFSINFPGTPQVTQTMFDSPTAGSIPLTKYMVESGSGLSTETYDVYVYHYPQSYQFPSDYLTSAMKTYLAAVKVKYPSATLTSSQSMQFLGDAAMAGTITITLDGQSFENYVLIITKGQNTYGIGTYGMDQSDFNAFVNSFSFE